MAEVAITVDKVSKNFKLPYEKNSSIKGALISLAKGKKNSYERQEVLKDVSFEIKKGEFFGIVGRNGSGKSTMLKMLAGIYKPTKGYIHINGNLTPFIELGVGFNPELTGRENVYLNGALLGFNRKEMNALYDDIVAFAELERFMDQKLKNYSSGMQVRLAFSIAIQAQTDILVLDEVLAVGDETFQRKCIAVFEQYKARNQTIILVTHDMAMVERFCDRAMLISDGIVEQIGSPKTIAALYSEKNLVAYAAGKRTDVADADSGLTARLKNPTTGKPVSRVTQGQELSVDISWLYEDVQYVGVALYKLSGEYIFGPNTYKEKRESLQGKHGITYSLKLDVGPGDYYLKIGLFGKDDKEVVAFMDNGPSVIVEADKRNENKWEGITYLAHSWKTD